MHHFRKLSDKSSLSSLSLVRRLVGRQYSSNGRILSPSMTVALASSTTWASPISEWTISHSKLSHRNASSSSNFANTASAFVATAIAAFGLWNLDDTTLSPERVSLCESATNAKEEEKSTNNEDEKSSPSTTTILDFDSIGVNEEDVDALVEGLLKDKNVNIYMLPDRLEAQLYKSTILLTLNAIYNAIGGVHGTKLLSHEISVSMERDTAVRASSRLANALVEETAKSVNDPALKQVAKRLLENPAINSMWVPDALEEQIYFACLQVMFRATQIVLSTVKVQICGHELKLQFAFDEDALESAVMSSAKTMTEQDGQQIPKKLTPIDFDLLRSMARQAGVDEEKNPDYWWNRIFTRSDFVRQLHVSLYGLILGILDDLFLGQLQVQILSDTIQFDLVPATNSYGQTYAEMHEGGENDESSSASSKSSLRSSSSEGGVSVGSFAAASFAAGIGVGVTLMAALSNSQR